MLFHWNTHKTGNNAVKMSQAFHDITRFKHFTDLNLFKPYLTTLPVFLGVSKFFIRSPGLPVRAPNLPRKTYRGLFQTIFIDFVIFEMSKRKIEQEVDLVLLFEQFSIRNVQQSNQIDIYLTSIVIGQKSTNQTAQYVVESCCSFRTLLYPGYQRFFLAELCWPQADMSSATGRRHQQQSDRNRKPRMKSLWHPG